MPRSVELSGRSFHLSNPEICPNYPSHPCPRPDQWLLIDGADHVRVIVLAIALATLSGTLGSIPAVGVHLANIVASVGVLAAGAAIMVILRNVYARFKP